MHLEQLEAQFGKKPEITERFKKKEEYKDEEDHRAEDKDEGEGSKRVDFRKIDKEVQKQSLDARLEVVHTQVWPVDFNYSLRRRSDSLDTEGFSSLF